MQEKSSNVAILSESSFIALTSQHFEIRRQQILLLDYDPLKCCVSGNQKIKITFYRKLPQLVPTTRNARKCINNTLALALEHWVVACVFASQTVYKTVYAYLTRYWRTLHGPPWTLSPIKYFSKCVMCALHSWHKLTVSLLNSCCASVHRMYDRREAQFYRIIRREFPKNSVRMT